MARVYGAVVFVFAVIRLTFAGDAKKPNIVFILADDLGFNDVGYHNGAIISPNIDKLAHEGVRLENYYVQPVCTPSRSQLMTGRYQIHTGLQHDVIYAVQPTCLPLDEVTLAEKLKEAGYATHAVGKWHLGFYRKECLPTSRGFDSHYGLYCGKSDYYTKMMCGYFEDWEYSRQFCGYDFHDNEKTDWSAALVYSSELFADRSRKIILEHDQTKPLFLYLPFQSVHFPLEAPERFVEMYFHIEDPDRRMYSAMVTAMDEAIGVVLKALDDAHMTEDTLIIFSTDNGGSLSHGASNSPLRGGKASLWEGGIRAVGLVSGYGVSDGGRINKGLFHISDWFPTLVHIAGGNVDGTKPLDGHNIWDALAVDGVSSPRTEILHNIDPYFPNVNTVEFQNDQGVNTTRGHAALRMGKWKLITGDPGYNETVTDDPTLRLFDIENDPSESTNLASQWPAVVNRMLTKLSDYNATAVPLMWPDPDVNSDPGLRGYVWNPWSD